MDYNPQLIGMVESFLFIAGDEGLSLRQLCTLTETAPEKMETIIRDMKKLYDGRIESGITLKLYGGQYRLVTKAEFADSVMKMLENPSPKSLTQASFEVLAIIAYRQPVTRVEVDDLRGVKSEGPIQTLIAKGLIMEKGRLEGSGRPILYGTTDLFLDRFGIPSLDQLPPLSTKEDSDPDEDTDLFMTKFQEAFDMDEEGGHDE